jgi:hypothetical protein
METRTQKETLDQQAVDGSKLCSLVRTRKVIVFGLRCDEGHEFEGWFRSNDDFDQQQQKGNLACPACASTHVKKAIMAPNLALGGLKNEPAEPVYGDRPDLTLGEPSSGETIAQLEAEIADMRRQIKEELRDYVETNFDYVGEDFPAEARRRYYEADERGAYGEATVEDMVAMIDEGVPVAPLPDDPASRRKKMN